MISDLVDRKRFTLIRSYQNAF